MKYPNFAFGLIGLCCLGACNGDGNAGQVTALPQVQAIEQPPETGDGWATASLSDVGIEESAIVEAVNQIRGGVYNEIHGFVVVKDNKLVLEEYGSGRMYSYGGPDHLGPTIRFDRDELHIVHSVSKSFMSTLVGIAIREGFIPSEDEPLLTFFPEHADPNAPGKADILLKHVMSMSSGLEWNEWDVGTLDFQNNDNFRYQVAVDPCAYFFGKSLLHEPGTSFYYNTAGFQMMGEVLRRATAMPVDRFADQYLFRPLGISDFDWQQFEHGPVYLVGDLFLKPRDMAKFGQMVLQGGQWNGQQVVPAEWLAKATSDYISVAHTGYKGFSGYGLHWWRKTFNIEGQTIEGIHADGLAGQAIMVFPALDLVVVVTGGNYSEQNLEHELVANHVLRAVIG